MLELTGQSARQKENDLALMRSMTTICNGRLFSLFGDFFRLIDVDLWMQTQTVGR